MRHVTCCLQCVPPKRHTACQDSCPELRAQLAAEDARIEALRKNGNADFADYYANKIISCRQRRKR